MKLAELLEQWRSDDLKEYVRLLGGPSTVTRKAERIAFITEQMLDRASLRIIWNQLDGISRRAISVAFHNGGEFNQGAFVAQYGTLPPRPKRRDGWSSYFYRIPILFDLFVIGDQVPNDVLPLLSDLVLPPERFQVEGVVEPPAQYGLGGEVEDITIAETEIAGRTDLITYLRLMEQGQLRFGVKNQRLTAASLRNVLDHLVAGDFRASSDTGTARTSIRPVGLDIFVQESTLATRTGKLTKAGREYLRSQDPEIMLEAFEQWTNSGRFDELQRITTLRGLNSRATQLTDPSSRRDKVIEALSWCPTGQWIEIGDFYRAVLIWNFDFDVEQTQYSNLYVVSPYYGDLNSTDNSWRIIQGLYINIIIWEFLATIGAVDVAFLADETGSLIDTGYLPVEAPFSPYDGLTHFRINPWGAYLLGQADQYVPTQPRQADLFTIDAKLRIDLLAPLTPNERLQLEVIADCINEQRYQLDQTKLLDAVESGQSLDDLIGFLHSHHRGEMLPDVVRWLDRLRRNRGAFAQRDSAVLVQLKRGELMDVVRQDEVLAKICHPMDGTTILVRSAHVGRFRTRLKSMGYLLD